MRVANLIGEMAAAVWASVDGRGPAPRAAMAAAYDLAELYERMNNANLPDLTARFPDGLSGEDLVAFAMTPGRPFVTQMKVPAFAVTLNGDDLEWDGGERDIRNPAKAAKTPRGPLITAAQRTALNTLRAEAHTIMSDAAADRLVARIDTALATGVLDTQTAGTLALMQTYDDDTHDNPAARSGDNEFWVLLIEDEPSKQVSTTRMIKKLYPTAQVIVSDNGAAAIANLDNHDVKLVISDVDILGSLSGVDVFKWVKANQPHLVDQYVFFTGNDSGEMYDGVTPIHYRILQKPAGVKDLGEMISAPSPHASPRARTVTRQERQPTPPREAAPPTRYAAPPVADSARLVGQAVSAVLPEIGPEGRLVPGSQKIWIAAAYRAAIARGMPDMSLPEFKRALIAANRQGIVSLARQDLRVEKDRDIAIESEIVDLGSSFHFIIDPAGSPW